MKISGINNKQLYAALIHFAEYYGSNVKKMVWKGQIKFDYEETNQ